MSGHYNEHGKPLMDGEYFVVSGTHPKQPNFSGHSRGRAKHLAVSRKRNTKTLCNLTVDDWLYDWEKPTKYCRVCFNPTTQNNKDKE